ncbi:hypothetical protein SH668x_003057 [Planctomicrobium sp. SH668]|uniref:hypothetical protein n=1 Tax=Planctomicrobium sp. SH668 TaxID=3448126 RepID=UPI003F5C0BC5
MWCEQCLSDVATEISADGQQLLCTNCGQPVRKVLAPSLHPETKSAREFLERWAREQQSLGTKPEKTEGLPSSAAETQPVLTPAPTPVEKPRFVASVAGLSPVTTPTTPAEEIARVEKTVPAAVESTPAESAPKKKLRLDSQHDAPAGPIPTRKDPLQRPQKLEKVIASGTGESTAPQTSSKSVETSAKSSDEPIRSEATQTRRKKKRRIDQPQPVIQPPHFELSSVAPQKTIYPGKAEAVWGQLMAYSGVGLLTVGTVFVLWGYFGEIEQYASTGWLMSTAGQMLLLLGVVTLIGGGMQQTTHEVSQRIEHLGGRIIRIEESTVRILNSQQPRRIRKRSRPENSGDQEAA